jgi:hypothetical protein
MTRVLTLLAIAVFVSTTCAQEPKRKAPQVEVVFVLDTTGSMRDVLVVMTQKVFALCGQIKSGKPGPDLKVGFVAYKDRGDEYVTKLIPLTADLDTIYEELKKWKADGGGDTPESVNQALNEAVEKMEWDKATRTMKLIFLIGDAPPHMDYKDDVKYMETCKKAAKYGITINTVRNGNSGECATHFGEIAKLGKGQFLTVPQDGGKGLNIAAPQDKRLAEINAELIKLAMPFGPKADEYRKKLDAMSKLPEMAAADRAVVESRRGDPNESDLVEMVAAGKAKLDDVPAADLPAEVKRQAAGDRANFLAGIAKRRQAFLKEAGDLDTKRAAFLVKTQKEMAKKNPQKTFDQQMLEVLRKQAARYGIGY